MTELDLRIAIAGIAEYKNKPEQEIKAIPTIENIRGNASTTAGTGTILYDLTGKGFFIGSITINYSDTGTPTTGIYFWSKEAPQFRYNVFVPQLVGTTRFLQEQINLISFERITAYGSGQFNIQLIGYKLYY